MLIKLRNEFYQVQCDAFVILATDLLDIRPKIRHELPDVKNTRKLNHLGVFTLTPVRQRVDIPDAVAISLARRQRKEINVRRIPGRIKLGKGEYG
jgi:hypothetical protein